jgi:putative alpha-1,2-mannosidase
MILNKQYSLKSEGMGGNDDCGQMSAWYIFSALGFYPFAPGSPNYALTTPLVKEATLQLDGQHILQIVTENNSDQNVYIQAVYWNGKRLSKPFISHLDLMQGGELRFILGSKPAQKAFALR